MKTNIQKLSVLLIAAVLLVGVAFAGAASAVSITADVWNSMTTSEQINGNSSYAFTGSGIINPKFNDGSSSFTPTRDITFDFKDFTGTFAGDPSASTGYRGSLFGYIENTTGSIRITIANLTLSNVVVNTSSGSYIGGVVGYFYGKSKTESFLNFSDCRLVNCSITGSPSSGYVGGLVGWAFRASVNVVDCKALHCDVVSGTFNVGGLVGSTFHSSVRFERCNVTNSTVAALTVSNGNCVGGLVGRTASSASFEMCGVENTSVYAGDISVGGLVGKAETSVSKIGNCSVVNCVVASDCEYVGGLVGSANSANGIGACTVNGCTIAGSDYVGGLVGYADSATVCSSNQVISSAVNGTGSMVRLDCGNGLDVGCTADVNTNFIRNMSSATSPKYEDTITLCDRLGNPLSLPNADFWKTIYKVTGHNTSKFGGSVTQVTYLGMYGQIGGYGVGSAPKLTYDKNGATTGEGWTVACGYGVPVTVADKGSLARAGMFFNGWNTQPDGSGTSYAAGSLLTITGDTTLYAQWSTTVEVDTWDALKEAVEGWTSNEMGTIVVTGNVALLSGTNFGGIEVKGNITIMPKAGEGEKKIDANQKGRLFNVTSSGSLTLKGNNGATLNLTGGKMNRYGGAIHVGSGNLILSDGVTIAECSVTDSGSEGEGGGVFVDHGAFTMDGGNIVRCSAKEGGGVFVHTDGTFNMYGGNITDCRADVSGGGVNVETGGTFNVKGSANVTGNTKSGKSNDVFLTNNNLLNLVGQFTGSIGIVKAGVYPAVGASFGTVDDRATGADHFFSDDGKFVASVVGNKLVWNLKEVSGASGVVTFGGTNETALKSQSYVSKVVLENVTGLAPDTSVVFVTNNTRIDASSIPTSIGYTKNANVAVFELNLNQTTSTGKFNVTVYLTNVANQDKVRFWHYNTTNGWDTPALSSTILGVNGNNVTYTVTAPSFSPFGITIETKAADPTPVPQTSRSRETGKTIILTATPTPVPTITPTGQPTTVPGNIPGQQTRESPAPFIGLIAGLGVAAVLLRLRK